MTKELNPKALGYAGAGVSAGIMFLLGVLGNAGIYESAAQEMVKWHMFFSLDSAVGIISGIVEAAVLSFVFMYAFAMIYNKFA